MKIFRPCDRMFRVNACLSLISSLLLLVPTALAEVAANPLKVSLLCDHTTLQAGQTATLGILLQHPPGYHTYWQHPGVVGLATSAVWTLPAGFQTSALQWPAPEKVMMSIHPAQGYKTDTVLLVPLTVAANVAAGDYELKVALSWMCCARGCFPGHAVPFTLHCHVGEKAEISAQNATRFAQARAQLPQLSAAWKSTFRSDDTHITLELQALTAKARAIADLGDIWFFSADGAVDSSAPQRITREKDRLILEMQRFEFGPKNLTHLPGVLRAAKSWDLDSAVPFMAVDAQP